VYQSTIIEAVLSQWLCVTIPNECTKMKKSVCLHEKLENVEWDCAYLFHLYYDKGWIAIKGNIVSHSW
jgi:hypothetical protein